MRLVYKSLSLTGPKGHNQDCLLEPLNVEGIWWCAVADGMGGAEQGEVASEMCIMAIRKSVEVTQSMGKAFSLVSESLFQAANSLSVNPEMGSTLSVLQMTAYRAFVGHVGDTRITHYRAGGVMSRTHDQTEVQKLIDDGVISKYQARRYPRRNVIMSVMSPRKKYDLFENQFTVKSGDRILLTTDGFHGILQKGIINQISVTCPSFDTFFQEMENEILRLSLTDDATCLAIEIA